MGGKEEQTSGEWEGEELGRRRECGTRIPRKGLW